jgi:hypothetical protein
LERENGLLRQRLGEVGALVEKARLAEYQDRNGIHDLAVVGDREPELESPCREAVQEVAEEAVQGAADTAPASGPESKLINFDSITATGLDTMTLDDLNDDDFDPRAFDQSNSGESSDTSDDFNPRGSGALQVSLSPAGGAPGGPPARLAPPPTLAPRDPAKVAGKPVPGPAIPPSTNPFSAPPPATAAPIYPGLPRASDPFGMSSFAAGGGGSKVCRCWIAVFSGFHFRTPSPLASASARRTSAWTSWTLLGSDW